jgi:hypothetical protein
MPQVIKHFFVDLLGESGLAGASFNISEPQSASPEARIPTPPKQTTEL